MAQVRLWLRELSRDQNWSASCRPPAGPERTGTSQAKLTLNGHKRSLAPTVEQFVTALWPAADPLLASPMSVFGIKRTSQLNRDAAAFDPRRTSTRRISCDAQRIIASAGDVVG